MNLQKTKIYNDGSHYIGIPQGAYPSGKGCKRHTVKATQQTSAVEQSFETAYKESQSLPKRERKSHIKAALKTDFADTDGFICNSCRFCRSGNSFCRKRLGYVLDDNCRRSTYCTCHGRVSLS